MFKLLNGTREKQSFQMFLIYCDVSSSCDYNRLVLFFNVWIV